MPKSTSVLNLKFLSNYTCSKCTKWVPKFTILAPRPITPSPLWGILSSRRLDMRRYICTPHIKFLATPVPNWWKGDQNLQIWPLQPLGEIFCHPWGGTCQNLPVYQNLKFLTTHVPKVRNGFQNLQFWHIDPSPPSPLWVILSSRRLDMPRYTTYKISSYTRSKLMKGGPKFTNLALRAYHTPLGEIFCHPWGGTCQNLPVYKIWSSSYPFKLTKRGPHIYKFGP